MEKEESETTTAASLTFDVLVSIFRFLDTDSKGKVAQVCTFWKKAADSKSLWKTVKIKLQSKHLNIQAECSITKRGICHVDLNVFEPRFYDILRRIPDLEHLRFTGCCVKENMLNFFKTAPNSAVILKLAAEVEAGGNNIPDHLLERLAICFPSFHGLNPYGCLYISGHILKTLSSGMRKLKVLELDGCLNYFSRVEVLEFDDHTSEENSKNEDQLMSLQDLYIRNTPSLNKESLAYIGQKFVNLQKFHLSQCPRISDGGLEHLVQLKKLQALNFFCSDGITDEGFRHISQLANLTFLNLSYCTSITDGGFALISRLTNLKYLNLRRCVGVTDETLKQINDLKHLQVLDLHSCEISNAGLLNLAAGNLKLNMLDVTCCSGLGDQGLVYISESSFVSVLHKLLLGGSKFTDDGIISIIEKFSRLEFLFLGSCPFVTDECRLRIVEKMLHLNKNFKLHSSEYDAAAVRGRFLKLCSCLEPLAESIYMETLGR